MVFLSAFAFSSVVSSFFSAFSSVAISPSSFVSVSSFLPARISLTFFSISVSCCWLVSIPPVSKVRSFMRLVFFWTASLSCSKGVAGFSCGGVSVGCSGACSGIFSSAAGVSGVIVGFAVVCS